MKQIFLFFVLVIICVSAEEEEDLSSQIEMLQNNFPALSKMFGKTLPNIEEGDDLMRAKCLKNGNNESFETAVRAKQELQNCVNELIDITLVKAEIEKAKPEGELDSVIRKYCGKLPELKTCIKNATIAVDSCLDENDKSQKKFYSEMMDTLFNFICFKDGDRIALFIAEGGPECLTSKAEAMQQCANTTAKKYEKDVKAEGGPTIKFDETECLDLEDMQKCVVEHLENCKETTTANIMQSLFQYIVRFSPCSEYLKKGDSSNLQNTVLSILLPTFAIILSKFA